MNVGTDLTVSFKGGKAYAAYLTFRHPVGVKVHRTREMEPDILVDFARDGQPLGIEMLDPRRATLAKLNRVMKKLQLPSLEREIVRPLRGT